MVDLSNSGDNLGIGGSLLGPSTAPTPTNSPDPKTAPQPEAPQWQAIASSNLAAVKYDPTTETLGIKFHSGKTYTYRKVPSDVYDGLISASSAGRYFIGNIKHSYEFNRGG